MFSLGDHHTALSEVTWVAIRPGQPFTAVSAAVQKTFAAWGRPLSPLVDLVRESASVYLVPFGDDRVAIVTDFSHDDALAHRLSLELETSALWQRHTTKYLGGFEVLHGPMLAFPPPDLEELGPPREAFLSSESGRLKRVRQTKQMSALRCTTRCPRGHEGTLDLTRQPAAEVQSDGLDPGFDRVTGSAPSFYPPLQRDELEGSWFRLKPVEPVQQVLCCAPCFECEGIGYAELTWERGAFRSVRALRAAPRSFGQFHVVLDPEAREPRLDDARRARARSKEQRRGLAEEVERARQQPLTEAAIDAAIATERRDRFVELLVRGAKYGPPELVARAVDRLFEYEQRCYDRGERPEDLQVVLLLDFECALNSHAHAMVALECVRFGLSLAAEKSMQAAAPLSDDTIAELRRRVQRVPLDAKSADWFEGLITRHATWSGPERPEHRLA